MQLPQISAPGLRELLDLDGPREPRDIVAVSVAEAIELADRKPARARVELSQLGPRRDQALPQHAEVEARPPCLAHPQRQPPEAMPSGQLEARSAGL